MIQYSLYATCCYCAHSVGKSEVVALTENIVSDPPPSVKGDLMIIASSSHTTR